jgi:hypothetical protein
LTWQAGLAGTMALARERRARQHPFRHLPPAARRDLKLPRAAQQPCDKGTGGVGVILRNVVSNAAQLGARLRRPNRRASPGIAEFALDVVLCDQLTGIGLGQTLLDRGAQRGEIGELAP